MFIGEKRQCCKKNLGSTENESRINIKIGKRKKERTAEEKKTRKKKKK